jgi:hypothetical protein
VLGARRGRARGGGGGGAKGEGGRGAAGRRARAASRITHHSSQRPAVLAALAQAPRVVKLLIQRLRSARSRPPPCAPVLCALRSALAVLCDLRPAR